MAETLLAVEDLHVRFRTSRGPVHAVNGVSFSIEPGETLGLVGESGCGKSVTSLALLGILARNGKVTRGRALFEGRDLIGLSDSALRQIRGKEIAMIFQNPREALNPVITVGRQLTQVLRIRRGMSRHEARQETINIVKSVHISDPESRLGSYPHQLSGGMAQRIMISLALSCQPRLLIADEPTTGLDVTTQYQIVQLLRELRQRTGMAILLITHDLALAAQICDRVAVLYAGRIAEVGPTEHLFRSPRHPYTRALLASRPRLGLKGDIVTIAGNVANLMHPPGGCRFHPRCPNALSICSQQQPELEPMEPGQRVACYKPVAVQQQVAASG